MTENLRLQRPLLWNSSLTLLALNGLIELFAALFMFFNLPGAMERFDIDYSSQLDILGLVMGNALLFVAGIAALGIVWTLRGKAGGVICGIAVGIFLTSFGLLAFLMFGQVSAIGVDGVRGGLNILLGILLLRGAGPRA
jgi:hypothetical protein